MTMGRGHSAAVLFAALAGFAPAAHPAPVADRLPEPVIRAAMAMGEVPGLALAVARRGRPDLIRVFGLRDVARGLPVTPRTLFAVGSIAKSFTVLGLAMLADEGRLDWDAPVRRYAPGLVLGDGALADTASLRDLVTHRTGMPRHDALWYLNAYDRAGLLARLRFLKPAAPLGAVFAYNNLMFAAAGHVLARLDGASWEEVMQRRILGPLGMTHARLTLDGFRAAPDRASPYFPGEKGRISIPLRDTGPVAPAAAVYADAVEMGRYLRLLMNDGRIGGKRLLSVRAARDMRRVRIAVRRTGPWPERGPTGYAMGLNVSSYRGHALVYHPGAIDGYAAMLSFLPDDGIGIVALSNLSGGNPVPSVVSYAVYDGLLGLAPLPWRKRLRARFAARDARRARPAPPPAPVTPPPRPLDAYTGDYRHPAYGLISLRAGPDGTLAGALHAIRFTLVHRLGEGWQVEATAWPLRAGLRFRFRFDGHGRAAALATPLADGPTYRLPAGDLVFTRAP